MLIDSHCHLDFPELAERLPAVLAAAEMRGPPARLAARAPCSRPARSAAPCARAVTQESDDGWQKVTAYDTEKERDLVADTGPPVKVIEDRAAVKVTEPRPGVYVFDLGQNIVGWARLRARTYI